MKKISIDTNLSDVCNGIKLGCIQYNVCVAKSDKILLQKLDAICQSVEENYTLEKIGNHAAIKAARDLYRSVGKDPYRYRISSEALMRRIVQGKGIYHINNVVDCNNLISIKTGLSVGSYNTDNLIGSLIFRVGNKEESYKGIGKEIINVENLPVFADDNGAYGSPTSDSERAMITNSTTNVLTVLISFDESFDMDEAIEEAVNILQECVNATDIETCISQCV